MEGVCLIDVMEGGSLADVMREFPYVYKKILFEMEVQKKILHHKIIIISISLKNCNFSKTSQKQLQIDLSQEKDLYKYIVKTCLNKKKPNTETCVNKTTICSQCLKFL
jgi:hypothetical protein